MNFSRDNQMQALMQFIEAQNAQMLQMFQAVIQRSDEQFLQALNSLVNAPEPASTVNFQRDANGRVVGALIQ